MIGLAAANLWAWGCLAAATALALALALALAAPLLLWGRLRGGSVSRVVREGVWLYGRVCLALWRPVVRVAYPAGWPAVFPGTALVAANHQSWLDIYLLAAQANRDICFLVRGWPFRRLFFFGPLMRLAGYIETEGAGWETVLARCRAEAARGATLVAFPEGTRGPDGALGRFHSGLFKLAWELGLPVQPLIIRHSGRVMPKGSLIFRPGLVRLAWGPPLRPEDFVRETLPHGALRRAARLIFRRALILGPD